MFNHFFDILYLLKSTGPFALFVVWAIIFVESGLFFGFFLPGDSLLFTAGFVAAQGVFSFPLLLIGTIVCALLAGYVGYWFGRTVGHKLFEKADSLFFHRRHLEQTKKFFEKYGQKTVLLSRFIPVVRTFGPIFAGIGEMDFHRFSIWNIIGGVLWPLIMISAGFYLGHFIPGAERYFLPLVLIVVIVSILPGVWEWWKNRKKIA